MTTTEEDESLQRQAIVTFTGVAHPWMCDAMGHVNVRHYAAMFDDASFHLLGRIASTDSEMGWADVRFEIDFEHEIAAGALLTVTSHVEKLGKSSLVYVHVMAGTLDGAVRARARVVTVRFDLARRCKVEIDATSRSKAEAMTLRAGPG
jgi:acyl-CoA thioester hydrolase